MESKRFFIQPSMPKKTLYI